jgi:hypothetical protein
MKMKDVFIGQIVVTDREHWKVPYLPQVGKVVDIAYEYNFSTIVHSRSDTVVRVLPVVHFLGEPTPRAINPINIEPYNPD